MTCSAFISKAYKLFTGHLPLFECCCVQHDKYYGTGFWNDGASSITRWEADAEFFWCIHDTGRKWQARIFWAGLRVWGPPWWYYYRIRNHWKGKQK